MSDRFGGTNVAWMRGYSERFINKGNISLDTIGRVISEAADEITRLRSRVEELERELAEAIAAKKILSESNYDLCEKLMRRNDE